MQKKRWISVVIATLFATSVFADDVQKAPVSGFARNFVTGKPVPGANITVLEDGEKFKTDNAGRFGPIQWPVGKPITLVLEKIGFRTLQSATVTVPAEGLTTPLNNISFQAVDLFSFGMLTQIIGAHLDEQKCHVVTTITAYHKTLDDSPQGEAYSQVLLTPEAKEVPFYFDIFKDGPLKNGTNPFTRGLKDTSLDGGVVIANVDPRDEPYTITAVKAGVTFSQAKFICRKGMFINLSPPQGPSAQNQ